MILKIIIFAIAGLLIYKFFGGKLPSFRRGHGAKKLDKDTLVECEKCGTYVTVRESLIVQGRYYCSEECAK